MIELLKSEYREMASFLKERRRILLFVLIFSVLVTLGAAWGINVVLRANPAVVDRILQYIYDIFATKEGIVDSSTGALSAFGLFKNNFVASFLIMAVGIVPFLFLPLFYLALNFVIVAFVAVIGVFTGTTSLGEFLALIVPHGIFEIPALILAAALGVMLCMQLIGTICTPFKERMAFGDLVHNILRTVVLLIVPLLILAGVFEAYVSPLVYSLFF